MRQQQHARQDHRPERIDMLERIEADPAKLLGGVVAEPIGHKGVRGLVESDGDEERQDPDRYAVQVRCSLNAPAAVPATLQHHGWVGQSSARSR